MHMRVQAQVLSPGMQYGNHTCFGLQFSVTELRYGLPCAGKQQVVKECRVVKKQPVQCIRNGENHMEVRHRQQVLFAAFDPCFALGILAFGAMPVTAGVITDADMSALIAFVDMSAQ